MVRLFRLFLAFLSGLLGLARRPARKRAKVTRRTPPRGRSVTGQARALAKELQPITLPNGTWEPSAAVRVEEGRLLLDLHGLSDEDAVAVVEETLTTLDRPVPLRLVTGHGRDRPAGYSLIRVALVQALARRNDVVIDDLARHQRHARSDDRLGHMDVLAR